jgi:hypothetical protein
MNKNSASTNGCTPPVDAKGLNQALIVYSSSFSRLSHAFFAP